MKLFLLMLLCVLITIQLSAQGVTSYGQSTTISTVFVSKNGQSANGMMLNKNGQILVSATLFPSTVASLCYNTSPGTFTANGTGGNGTYTYLWYKDGASTGIATQTYNPGNLTASSSIYCAVTSGSYITTNTLPIAITGYGNLTANIDVVSSTICYNSSPGTFTATGGGGTGAYSYLWYLNGASTGITTQTYNPGNLTATSTFYCAITSGSCGTANSSTTTITVNADLTASINIGSQTICYNVSPGIFTATGGGGTGTYTYLWYLNGISTGVTTQTYNPGNLTTTKTFYCAITSGSCGTVNTSSTTITVNSNLTAGINIGSQTICYNTSPGTFTATGAGGNGTYTYLWYLNGASTGVATQNYSPGNLTATSTIYCAITSGSCGTVNSATTTITVNANLTAGINIGSQAICYNTSPGTFTATGGGGTGTYTYLWYSNGASTGITAQSYNPGNLTTTSTFYCAVTGGTCGTINTSTTTITLSGILTAGINIGSQTICYNSSPGTFTATGGGGTGSYTYLWYNNGASTGVTTQTYNPGNMTSSSLFYCAVTSGSCGTVNSSTTTISVYASLTAGINIGSQTICYNTSPGTFSATGGGGTGTYTYLWYKNGASTGLTAQTYNPGSLTATSTFYCVVTSGTCGTVNTSTTTITLNGILTAGINIGSQTICYQVNPGTFMATGGGGTGTYSYAWYKNGSLVGIWTQSYDPGYLKASATYYCQISNSSCGLVNTPITTITVNSKLTAGVNFSGTKTIPTNTSPGTFIATGGGGTGSYTYLWYKDNISTGVTTNTYNPGNMNTYSSFYCTVNSGSCGTLNTFPFSIDAR